jgi:hypothetical protein
MLKRFAALCVVCGAFLAFAAPAGAFSVVHPVSGECRQILVPATFPGNFEVVDAAPPDFPGPWNGHGNARPNSDFNTALGPVICP